MASAIGHRRGGVIGLTATCGWVRPARSHAGSHFRHQPNSHIDPLVRALPGTLPVRNQNGARYAVWRRLGLICRWPAQQVSTQAVSYPTCQELPDLPSSISRSPKRLDRWWEVAEREDTYLSDRHRAHCNRKRCRQALWHARGDRWPAAPIAGGLTGAGVALAEIVSSPICARGGRRRIRLERIAGSWLSGASATATCRKRSLPAIEHTRAARTQHPLRR